MTKLEHLASKLGTIYTYIDDLATSFQAIIDDRSEKEVEDDPLLDAASDLRDACDQVIVALDELGVGETTPSTPLAALADLINAPDSSFEEPPVGA